MSLNIFEQDQNDAMANAGRRLAPDFPATFGEAFKPAWDAGMYFGQSISGQNTRRAALDDIGDEFYAKAGIGQDLGKRAEMAFDLPQYSTDLDYINERTRLHKTKNPDFQFPTVTEDDIQKRMVAKSQEARATYTAMSNREKTLGGQIGFHVAGPLAAGALDPVNVVAFPLAAPVSLGIVRTGLAWAGIAGGTQAAIELIGAPYRETVQPGYGATSEPAANVLAAAGFGGVLGAGFKGAANSWARVKTGEWPRTIRDAGNVVESEAQIASTNPLEPSVTGRQAKEPPFATKTANGQFEMPIRSDGGEKAGKMEFSVTNDAVVVHFPFVESEFQGRGLGLRAYQTLVDWALSQGKEFRSDRNISPSAVRVYDALERRGYEVVRPAESVSQAIGSNDAVQQAYEAIKEKQGRVGTVFIGDLIERSGLPKERVHDVLAEAARDGDVSLNRASNPEASLSTARREGALTIGDETFHTATFNRAIGKTTAAKSHSGEPFRIVRGPGRDLLRSVGAEAEVAHRQALSKTIDDLVAGREPNVDGIVTPEMAGPIDAVGKADLTRAEAAHVAELDRQITELSAAPAGRKQQAELNRLTRERDALSAPELPIPAKEKPAGPAEGAAVSSLAENLTPQKQRDVRVDPATDDAVKLDLDRLRAERGNVEIPMGEVIAPDGTRTPVKRKIEDVMSEIEARESAAKEIAGCATPPAEAAE